MTETDARREMFLAIQALLDGRDLGDSVRALADNLAAGIAVVAVDLDYADAFVDAIGDDIKRAIRFNWDHLRADRAQAAAEGATRVQ